MRILVVAATSFEILPLTQYLQQSFSPDDAQGFNKNGVTVSLLVTGVGPVATAFHIARSLAQKPPQLVLNAGIAGAFDSSLNLGDVVNVGTECFADLGVEEADGSFTDLFQLGLSDPFAPPFQQGLLYNPGVTGTAFLPVVRGLTVSKAHGHAPSIAAVRAKYPDAQIESMEGAAFFYACLLAGVPFLEIRAISNYIEPRNRDAWQLAPALDNLNKALIQVLESLIPTA